jgi:hypothetical protein
MAMASGCSKTKIEIRGGQGSCTCPDGSTCYWDDSHIIGGCPC